VKIKGITNASVSSSSGVYSCLHYSTPSRHIHARDDYVIAKTCNLYAIGESNRVK
jgi:hypothetical protein